MRPRLIALLRSPLLQLGLGLIISALFLYLALRNVDWPDVWLALREAHLGYVGLALISVGVNSFAKAWRWRILLAQSDRRLPFVKILTAFLFGQMLNAVLPIRLGELGRMYVAGMREVGSMFVAGTIVIEKLIDMICFALLFLLLIVTLPLPSWIHESSYVVIGLAVVAGIILVVFSRYRGGSAGVMLPTWIPATARGWIDRSLIAGFTGMQAFHRGRDIALLAGFSVLAWVTSITNILLALLACSLHLPLSASLLLMIALQLGITLSNAPAWIGVFEYVCVVALASFGIDQAHAFSFGVLLHGIVILPNLCAGILAFVYLRPTPKTPGIQSQSV